MSKYSSEYPTTVEVVGGTRIACEACRAHHMNVSGGIESLGEGVQSLTASGRNNSGRTI